MARKEYKYRKSITVNGKRKEIYAKTKQEFEEKLLKVKLEAGSGIDVTSKLTISDWYPIWWDMSKVTLRQQTAIHQKLNIEAHILPVIGNIEIRKLTTVQCARVFREMDKKGSSHGTQNNIYITLRQMLNSAVDTGIIMRNPCNRTIKLGGAETKEKQALSKKEEELVRNGLMRYGGDTIEIFDILIGTGMRIGELLALKWEDVDLINDELTVHATAVWPDCKDFVYQDKPKSKSGNRRVPFGKSVHDAFITLRAQGNIPYCIMQDGHPYNHRELGTLHYRLSHASKEVKCSAHVLRHTYITRLADICNLNEMRNLAGHSSLAMTGHYTHYTDDQYQLTKAKLQA